MSQLSKEQQEFVSQLTAHQGQLRGLCCVLMPGAIHEADDVLQEVNRVILEKSGEFTPGTNFKSWAYAFVRFQVLAHQKRKSRNKLFFNSDLMVSLAEELERDVAFEQRKRNLTRCLGELKAAERELLDVRYAQAATLQQYADQIGRTVAGLKRSLGRVREKLKVCIRRKMTAEGAP